MLRLKNKKQNNMTKKLDKENVDPAVAAPKDALKGTKNTKSAVDKPKAEKSAPKAENKPINKNKSDSKKTSSKPEATKKVWVSDPSALVRVEGKRDMRQYKNKKGEVVGGTEYYGEKR